MAMVAQKDFDDFVNEQQNDGSGNADQPLSITKRDQA